MPARSPIRRDSLESIPRPTLVRLLAPFTAWLATHAFALDALESSSPDSPGSPEPLRELFLLLSRRDASLPLELAQLLRDLDAFAAPAGHEALLRAARQAAVLHPDLPGPALGALLFLEHPAVFSTARVVTACETISRYVEFVPDDALAPRETRGDALSASLTESLGPWFAARGRTPYVEALVLPEEHELLVEITHGDLVRHSAELDRKLVRAPRVVRRVRSDHAIVDRATLRLSIAACSAGEREALRRAFGVALLGSEDGFMARPLVDLDRLLRPLVPALGVVAARVTELTLKRPGRPDAILKDAEGLGPWLESPEGRLVTEEARVLGATLFLSLLGRARPLRIELAFPASVRFDRRHPAVEERVRAWLTARGVLTSPSRRASGVELASHAASQEPA